MTLAATQKDCHNIAVTVERDVQSEPSITLPRDVSTRRASQPQGGFIDLSREGLMTGQNATADTQSAKPTKPATLREFERALQTLGYSQRESKAISSNGFRSIYPVAETEEQLNALVEKLAHLKNIFESTTT
jgi:hypothetical protein